MVTRKVKLLNSSGEALRTLDWQDAIVLLVKEKAYPATDEFIEIQTTRTVFQLPKVIMLFKYVHIPFSIATPSKKNVMKRDNYQCAYCLKKLVGEDQTIDHVLPRSKGGKHTWENIVCACKRCNSKKGNKLLSECGMKLKITPHAPSRAELV